MSFKKPLPTWKAQGIQPPEHKLEEGWKAQDKPPAGWLNWQANTTYEALQELQDNAVDHRDVTSEPSANGVVRLNEAGKLNEAVLAGAEHKEISLKPGVQIVESDHATLVNNFSLSGSTLINRLGYASKFEIVPGTWGGLATVSSGVLSLTRNADVINPQSTILKLSLADVKVGDVLFIGTEGRILSDKVEYISTYLYDGTPPYYGQSIVRPVLGEWVRFGNTYEVTQEFLDQQQMGFKLVMYMKNQQNTSNEKVEFRNSFLYKLRDSDKSDTVETLMDKYPYVSSLTNVVNPYAIVTGDNLLPPFYEWETWMGEGDSCILSDQYDITINAFGRGGSYARYYVPAVKNVTYTLSVQSQGTNAVSYMYLCRSDKTRIDNIKHIQSITTTNGTDLIEVVMNTLSNEAPVTGTASFKKPMLSIGTEAKPFKPQQRYMWASECQLAANPENGSNADVLFTGDDGLPYVLEKWGKMTLDGNLSYSHDAHDNNATGYKRIQFLLDAHCVNDSEFLSKYNGVLLTNAQVTGWWTSADQSQVYLENGKTVVRLTIANTDSGWGDAYTPTADEIKAYFLGWKMGRADDPAFPAWNNDGTKMWYKLYCGVGTKHPTAVGAPIVDGSAVSTEPTVLNDQGYTPYRLQYLKATPTVESIRNYEQGLTLCAGSNVVEVGSGIVIREKSVPSKDHGGNWNLGNPVANSSSEGFIHKAHKVLSVYQNSSFDPRWELVYTNEYGALAQLKPPYVLDQTAVYHVTYTMLAPTLSAPINGNVATNLRGTVSDLVQRSGDVERRLSVVENQKAEKDNTVVWITPALLNGWTLSSNGVFPARYCKDGVGIVHVNGIVTGGATETVVFRLPAGYRPKTTIRTPTIIMSGTNVFIAYLDIKASGDVIAVFPTQSTHLSLQMSFLAEQ